MIFEAIAVGKGDAPTKDALDEAGHWLLKWADYRSIAIASLALVGIFVLIRRVGSGSWPDSWDCVRVGVGLLSVFSALTLFSVFFMTKPPAFQELSTGDLQFVGVVAILAAIIFGMEALKSFFK